MDWHPRPGGLLGAGRAGTASFKLGTLTSGTEQSFQSPRQDTMVCGPPRSPVTQNLKVLKLLKNKTLQMTYSVYVCMCVLRNKVY